ncbi:hypothetical protein BC831DRAFT_474967 [Entophlyctis helioformis]|nr:hypothetical protein BC831DRAFT_474967 [Entophlyctis helioformis]
MVSSLHGDHANLLCIVPICLMRPEGTRGAIDFANTKYLISSTIAFGCGIEMTHFDS